MRLLEENLDPTYELAEKLGINVSVLNHCLKALIEKGTANKCFPQKEDVRVRVLKVKFEALSHDMNKVPTLLKTCIQLTTKAARLINFSLRGATFGTRFLIIFFLAKYLDPAEAGLYGIFTASVGYAMYFVGLDFYTYVCREIVETPSTQRDHCGLSNSVKNGGITTFFLLSDTSRYLVGQSLVVDDGFSI